MKIAAIFLSAFCTAALGIPLDHVQHEKREAHPLLRKSTQAVDGSATFVARIAMKQRNLEQGMELLLAVSDPDSPRYGQHYTSDEVAELFAPDADSIDKVTQWLKEAGVDNVSVPKSRGFVDFETTTEKLESLLQTKYHIYDHTGTGSQQLGADEYHLPRAISEFVDFVTPGIVTGTVQKRDETPGRFSHLIPYPTGNESTDCDGVITPQCIADKYKIPEATLSSASNRLGLFETGDEMYLQSDLDDFYRRFTPNIPEGTGPKVDLINWNGRKPNPQKAGGEAALDFDMAIPIVYPQGTELFQSRDNYNPRIGRYGFFNGFLDAIDGAYCTSSAYGETGDNPKVDGINRNQMCGTFKPTNVISISYGLTEAVWPVNYQKRQCDEYMKLGLQGVTIVFASGDGGVAGNHGNDCKGYYGNIFNPPSPASCPYITSVGSVFIPNGNSLDDDEVATSRFASGGGFSNIWTRPDYQKSAVSSWFSKHDPGFPNYSTKDGIIPKWGGIYNKAGRGFPDVAALGDNGAMVFNGKLSLEGGTSMSAPIFAGIINRINEERIYVGKKPLGFINPALYKNPGMFNDITSGDQTGYMGDGNCDGKGFEAASGWDPVTGLGTPKYPEMLAYFMKLA